MKTVTIKTYEDSDYVMSQKIIFDGKVIWEARDLAMDCPEDATLSRDMTNAHQILAIAKIVGNDFEIENVDCKTLEEFNAL